MKSFEALFCETSWTGVPGPLSGVAGKLATRIPWHRLRIDQNSIHPLIDTFCRFSAPRILHSAQHLHVPVSRHLLIPRVFHRSSSKRHANAATKYVWYFCATCMELKRRAGHWPLPRRPHGACVDCPSALDGHCQPIHGMMALDTSSQLDLFQVPGQSLDTWLHSGP